MRNRLFIAIVSLILLVSSTVLFTTTSTAQTQIDEEDLVTRGWSNGRAWEMFSAQEKNNFLTGIEAGVALLYGELKSQTTWQILGSSLDNVVEDLTIRGFRFSDIVQQVDEFYDDRSNIRIPIAYSYFLVMKKMHGAAPTEVDKYASELRRTWNK